MHLRSRFLVSALGTMSGLAIWFRMCFAFIDVVTVLVELRKNLDDKEKRVAVDAQENS